MLRNIALALLAVASLVISSEAFAQRSLMADFGDNYASDGQNWNFDPATTFGFNPPATIPFALDFGSGPMTGLKAAPNFLGQAVFYDSVGNLLPDFIDVAYTPGQPWSPTTSYTKDSGLIDRSYVDNVPHNFGDPSAALPAFRIFWNGVCRSGDTACADDQNDSQFQAVFFYLSDEAFVLQFNYGSFANAGVDVGYSLGGDVDPIYTDTTISGNGPEFCFANGHRMAFQSTAACLAAASGGSTTVPEPDAASLLLIGSLGLAFSAAAARFRPRRTSSIAA